MIDIYRNFLEEDHATLLYNEICKTPANWWSHYIKTTAKAESLFYSNTLEGLKSFKEKEKELDPRTFSFRFMRSTSHVKNCDCYHCKFRKELLTSKDFLDFLSVNTSVKKPKLSADFVSIYNQGDYLGVHTDKGNSLAFVFNLTPNWRPEYGGLLNILEKGIKWQTVEPEFRSLLLFDVSGEGKAHFVSEISKFAPSPRVAISGWYDDES